MIHHFLLLNKHKNLSLKRRLDYKRNLFITVMLIIFSIIPFLLLFVMLSKEDIKIFSAFLLPVLLVLDLTLRFVLKRNTSAAIVPYLTLPIPNRALILYIIFSDLSNFWIWGCGLIYGTILYYCDVLTFLTAIILLLFILLNNYFVAFIKALIDNYAILVYPFCLGFILVLLFIFDFLSPVTVISIIAFSLLLFVVALFFTLKENLYKELSRIAL